MSNPRAKTTVARRKPRVQPAATDLGAHVGGLIDSLRCIEGCTGCKECRRLQRIGLRIADAGYRVAAVEASAQERRLKDRIAKAEVVLAKVREAIPLWSVDAAGFHDDPEQEVVDALADYTR